MTNNQILLKECIRQEFQENNSFANENEFFEFFAASQVLKNYNLSDDEITYGLIGGGLDGGCDAIYTFLNGDLIKADQIDTLSAPKGATLVFTVIQAKNTESFGEDVIMKWKTTCANLFNLSNTLDDYSNRYSDVTLDAFRIFRDALTKLIRNQIKVKILYYYVSRADSVHPNVRKQANELEEDIKSIYPSSQVEINFLGADELITLYNTDSEVNINLTLADQPIALGGKIDYVALINLSTYYKFITDNTGMLRKNFFEANVRDYQGNNSVNSAIANTLENRGDEDFWWLNNGVTVLAEKITPITNRELILTNPEIVNGLQTSTEIYKYFSDHTDLIDKDNRCILVRLIAPEHEKSRDNIIFSTNNQTSIPKSSLRVTDPIHLQIEMYFKNRGLYYDRRKNYYKNQKKKSTDIVGVSFLAQCLISIVLQKPDFARARPSTLLADNDTYAKLYENNQDLEAYYKAALLGKKIQASLLTSSDMDSVERNDILFYLLYAVVAKTLNKKEISFQDLHNLDIEQVTTELINSLKNKIYNKYKDAGGNSRVAKSPAFMTQIYNLLDFS